MKRLIEMLRPCAPNRHSRAGRNPAILTYGPTAIGLLAAIAIAIPATALEVDPHVPPEINFGGRALGTLVGGTQSNTGTVTSAGEDDSGLDFSDSSLLFNFNKYLFNGPPRYGFATVGLRRPDNARELKDEIYLHEANVGIGNRAFEVKLGRTRLRNTLLTFPTVRDDDLLGFTHVANAATDVDTDVYEIFGGVADVQWWPTRTVATNIAATSRVVTDSAGDVVQDGKINGANVGIAYMLPQSLKFDRGLRFAGISWDAQQIDALDDERLNAYLAGFIYNLNSNPEADWVWETQWLASDGAGNAGLADKLGRARARSNAVVSALRFNHRPYLQTRWQAALTLAAKEYDDFDNAQTFAVAPSFVYRLGSGVDWVAQYIYTEQRGALATQTGIDSEQRFYTGLSFGFDYTLNESVAERGSILAVEHNMTSSFGPGMGGGD